MFALICLLPFVLLLSWMLTFQLEHVHEAGIVVARDSIAYGIRMYSNAFQGYMRGQGSYAQGIFPMTSADLAPFGYRAPQTPPGGGVWSLGVATRAGAHSPFVCLSASVNGPGELEAIQSGASASGAQVLATTDCTAIPSQRTMVPINPDFPLQVVVVRNFLGQTAFPTAGT